MMNHFPVFVGQGQRLSAVGDGKRRERDEVVAEGRELLLMLLCDNHGVAVAVKRDVGQFFDGVPQFQLPVLQVDEVGESVV